MQSVPRAEEAEHYLHLGALLAHEGLQLLIPTPTLGEILAVVPAGGRAAALAAIEEMESVRIVSYDALAAVAAADLFAKPKGGSRSRPWQHVKIDLQVVACAVRYDAGGICALDGDHAGIARRSPHPLIVGAPARFLAQVPLLGAKPRSE